MEIMVAGWSDDGADITNEVKKYPANDFGLIWRVTLLNGLRMYIDLIDNEANDFNYFRGSTQKIKLDQMVK
jgi:hypothetical protein